MYKTLLVPEGTSGNWRVERFTIKEQESAVAMFRYGSRRPTPGTYTRLMCGSHCIMSDTPAERWDHYEPIAKAFGSILINGLGLGYVLGKCLDKEEVTKATVIELSSDVIKLVGPYYKNKYKDRVDIINADALEWKPPKTAKYGMVWHDIWPDICGDNYDDMKKLHRRYGRKAVWQGSWCKDIVRNLNLKG